MANSEKLTKAVRQTDAFGCVIASVATVLGASYDSVREVLGDPGLGFTHITWMDYLARQGFACQMFYRHDPLAKAVRSPWPLEPWADTHLCAVDAGRGDGTHLVVLLRDGRVLDPMSDETSRIADFPSVSYMAGIFNVGNGRAALAAAEGEPT